MSSTKFYALAIVGVVVLSYAAKPAAQYTVLVGTIGNDTVAVDRFTRDETSLEGVVFVRRPVAHTMHYKASLATEGRVTQMEIVWRDAAGKDMRSAMISFGIDSIRSLMKGGTIPSASAPVRLNAIPVPQQPHAAHVYGFLEHAGIILQLANRASTELEWITFGSRNTVKHRVTRVTRDTIEFDYIAGKVVAQIDSTKRLVSMTIGTTPVKTVVTRSDGDVNIIKLTANFADRDTLQRLQP